MSGWEGSDRLSRLPPDWPDIRLAVLERDGYRCQWRLGSRICGAYANHVDHKVAKLDDDQPEALQSLCEPHHRIKSSREGGQAAARKYSTKRPRRPHPGRIGG